MAARSPARSSAGPDVMCRCTPISAATMPAMLVLPSPGGPASSRWSAAWPRARPPRARSTGAPSARAGRRTRRAAAAAARPRRPPRRRRRRAGSRNSSRTPGSEQLEGVAQQRRGVGVGRQLAQRLADLLRRRSRGPTAPRARRRSPTRCSTTAAADRVEHRQVEPVLSSTSRRSAVFLPTPGTSVSAPRSAPATMSTSAAGGWVARIAIASAGPTPWVRDEHLERRALVAAAEAVQRLRVLADVVVDVQERRRRRLQLGQRPRRDPDDV